MGNSILLFLFVLLLFSLLRASILLTARQQGRQILAFGDSLTHGMVITDDPDSWKNCNHPFSLRLETLSNITVQERGVSGEPTSIMVERLPTELKSYADRGISFGVVTILGGTNDLGAHKPAGEIFHNLMHLHKEVHKFDSECITVALTIPDLSWPNINHSARFEINRRLREFSFARKKSIVLVDLETVFDLKKNESRTLFSKDTTHLSEFGYDTVGELIFAALNKM